jgi:Sperm-tail PG-rich repeat
MKETAPLWSFRGRNQYIHTEQVPGPGSYSLSNSVMHASPNYRLGTAKRQDLAEVPLTPGPGAYSPFRSLDTPSWTL